MLREMPTVHSGIRYPKDEMGMGCTYRWYVTSDVHLTKEEAIEQAQAAEAIEWESYRGAGQHFAHRPSVRRSRTRVLVTQTVGLDI